MRFAGWSALALMLGSGAFMSPASADVSKLGGAAHDCYVETRAATDLKAGIDACTHALDQDLSAGDRASTYINRANLYSMDRNFDAALADYSQALRLGEHVADIYTDRSAVYLSMARYAEAQHDADEALRLNTSRPEIAYFNRGVANEKLGNIQQAYQDYKASLAAKPGFQPAAENLTRFKVVKSSGS